MGKHLSISPEEAADRLAIRELVETYAHCADRDADLKKAIPTALGIAFLNSGSE